MSAAMVFDYKQPGAGVFSAGALVLARGDEHPSSKLASETFADEAQLVVGERDCAVLTRDGRVAGILGPGRHTLSARILPFLGSLVDARGGYAASIFFVTIVPIEGIRFGGRLAIPGSAQVMAFGSMSTRVVDPGRLATTMGPATAEDLGRYLGQKILPLVSACATEWLDEYFTIDTIGSAGRELAQTIQPHCVFFAELGLELPRFEGLTLNVRQ